MKIGDLFKGGGIVDKVVDMVDKIVPDKQKAAELKMKLIKLIVSQQSPIAPYVRGLIALLFMVVWLFFPEKFVGREDSARYILYAICLFYFMADIAIDKWKRK